jgi:hypothetical protein
MRMAPTTVRINGRKWPIIWAPEGPFDERALGSTDFIGQKIHVRSDLESDELRDTLLHEILHVLTASAGLDAECNEERFVRVIAGGLIGVFNDNPDLARFIIK